MNQILSNSRLGDWRFILPLPWQGLSRRAHVHNFLACEPYRALPEATLSGESLSFCRAHGSTGGAPGTGFDGTADADGRQPPLLPETDSHLLSPIHAAHSGASQSLPGGAQERCWPPSSAIICPVIAGAARMKRSPRQISSGVVPMPSGVLTHCSAKCSADCLGLGRVGPGPMPFTRMRGASARARGWVSVHNPALLRV